MKLWVEVYNAAGTFLGLVSNVIDAMVQQQLDSIGKVQITVVATDPSAQKLVAGYRVHLYGVINGTDTLLGQGILKKKSTKIDERKETKWEGPDGLEEFRQTFTGRQRVFDDVSYEDMVIDLTSTQRGNGWQVRVDAGLGDVSLLFDGVSGYKAIRYGADLKGCHVRLGDASNRLEIGVFGDVVLRTAQAGTDRIRRHPSVAYIDSLELVDDSYDVVNWIEPIAGGQGAAALTLAQSTLNTPYTVESETDENGGTRYFIKDDASIAQYGKIQRVYQLQNIIPISATAAKIANAADMLYQGAAEYLARAAVPKKTYKVKLRNIVKRIKPGDKIRVVYKGVVRHRNRVVDWVDLDELLYVVGIRENFSSQGHEVDLTVSNIDKPPSSAAGLLAMEIKNLQNKTIAGQIMTSGRIVEATTDTIDSVTPDTVNLTVQNQAVGIVSAELTVTRADTSNPDALTITVDGSILAGSPYLSGAGAGTTVTIDILQELISGAVDLHDTHTITIEAGGGSGTLNLKFDLVEALLQQSYI